LTKDFVSQVCDAFRKAVEQASGVPSKEGMEREFRRALARHLFDDLLGWEGHSKVAEIIDIAFFDDENFPIIIVETKWGVELTPDIKEKLRKRIEELGSAKYGVFASERDFVVYSYRDYELKDVAKVNVAVAVGVAKGEYGLSDVEMKNLQRLEALKRERLVWLEDPDYFERTHKEVSVAKAEGVKLLTENLKGVVRDLTATLIEFFDSYWKRTEYSGKYLKTAFSDWLKLSMKDEEFKKGGDEQKLKIVEVFCLETAYVLVGRILFIRICEDKGILAQSLSGKRFAEFLKFFEKRGNVYFRAFYDSREEIKKYYSHLHELGFFDWWWMAPDKIGLLTHDDKEVQEDLDADLDYRIKGCLRRLNRFNFAEVDRDILGDVYQGYLPTDERKRLGEFYTPKEVIEYILDAVGYKPENEIRGKKILDPSCGSGSFLVEATQRLMERYKRAGFNFNNPDDAKQIIEGCISSIYGLDIHPFASFIAEMNLLFQLVDLYNTLRQHDKYYELPRLHIYRTDSIAPSEAIELTDFLDNSKRKMLVEETRGADKVKSVKFDYLAGNPPYVRKERIPTEYKKKVLANTYPAVYHGDNDLYVYFIVKGIEWLSDEGKFGYIISRKFTKTRYGLNIRKYISDTCCVEQFVDFGDTETFRDVTNYPCILIMKKESNAQKRATNIVKTIVIKREENPSKLLKQVKDKINEEKYSDESIEVFEVAQKILGAERWKLVPSRTYNLFMKIKSNSQALLREIARVDKGIYTALDEVFVVDESIINENGLEKILLKPTLRGEDVRRYKISPKNLFLIYPKDVNIEEYPNTKKYLEKFRSLLEKRWCVTDPHMGRKWFELEKPRTPELYEPEKIITPDISDRNNFALDREKYYPLATCFVINPRENYKQQIAFLLGLLNSKVSEFYIKQISTYLRGKYYRYIKQYLEQLPIKGLETQDQSTSMQISRNVIKILECTDHIRSINEKMQGFPTSYFENDWNFDKLANLVKVPNLSQASYTISGDRLRTQYFKDLDGKDIFRIILGPTEFLDFYTEEVASYVLEVLKTLNIVTKRELLELKIPTHKYLQNLLKQYQKAKERIVENEKTVEDLDKQIDELVYKLYDISYAERRIIEDYSTKF
jgi:type I restriction-modification system DNA methylase subunit